MTSKATDARTAILDAAELLFAERGFTATTIKQIGEKSGQNPALIYYYFDNKATLYRHVLDRIFDEIARDGGQRTNGHTDPEHVVRGVIASQVAVLSRRPHLQPLLARELIDWKAANVEPAVRVLANTLFDRLRSAIQEGQRTGQFRRSLNPTFAAISIVAQVAYLLLARPIVGILLGRGIAGPTQADFEAFAEHAADFSIAALRAAPRQVKADDSTTHVPHDPQDHHAADTGP
ncbi:MAG TPA: TetR/AcrR family transcriptional regulator [Gemmatimonadaceae bacterium]